jgi:hypothetical protein
MPPLSSSRAAYQSARGLSERGPRAQERSTPRERTLPQKQRKQKPKRLSSNLSRALRGGQSGDRDAVRGAAHVVEAELVA